MQPTNPVLSRSDAVTTQQTCWGDAPVWNESAGRRRLPRRVPRRPDPPPPRTGPEKPVDRQDNRAPNANAGVRAKSSSASADIPKTDGGFGRT